MELTNKQKEAILRWQDPRISFQLYGGAIRGAKTAKLAIEAALFAMAYPNSRWVIMRSDRPKIVTNLLPTVSHFYSMDGIIEHVVKVNRSELTFTFDNGSVVQLFAESYSQDKDMNRFHGLEANGFFLDELSEFQEQTLNKCFERAGSWLNAEPSIFGKKPRSIVSATCNPTKNWVKTELYDKYIQNRSHEGWIKEGWVYIPAKITDNPKVPNSYYVGLKQNMTPLNYQRFVDGDWEYVESNGHEWIYNFDYSSHVQKVDYLPDVATYLTFDFNVWPYMTLICFQVVQIPDGYQVRFYDEFCLPHPKNTAEDVCKAWIDKYPKTYGKIPVSYCGDASGENKIPGFGDKKAFNAVRSTLAPYLHNSSDRVYKKQFFNEFVRKFINDIFSGTLRDRSQVQIIIDEVNCPKFIKDIQVTIENPNGGFIKEKTIDQKTKVTYEKNGHCVDAGKYGLLSVFSGLYENQYHNNKSF